VWETGHWLVEDGPANGWSYAPCGRFPVVYGGVGGKGSKHPGERLSLDPRHREYLQVGWVVELSPTGGHMSLAKVRSCVLKP